MRTPGCLEIQALALLGGLLFTSACAQFEVADRAVSYSLAVESATNRMLLLNAVRASKRYPMHFGAIRIVRGDVPVSGQLGITIPFGAGATDVFTLSPTVTSIRSGTSFDLSILNTQEFYRGILTPLPAGTLHYYQSQGWPKELLLHLFVRQFSFEEKKASKENLSKRIGEAFQSKCPPDSRDLLCHAARQTSLAGVNCSEAIQKADSENQPYVNAPWDTCGFLRFQSMMRKLRVLGLELTKADEPTITKVPTKVTTKKTNGTETVTEESVKVDFKYSLTFDLPDAEIRLFPAGDAEPRGYGSVLLRSPEAMVFYMGELIQVQHRDDRETYVPTIFLGPPGDRAETALFEIQKVGAPTASAILCVEHEGQAYCIPRGKHRSMHVLSLVSQILAQQQSAQELPVTPTLRVIGQ